MHRVTAVAVLSLVLAAPAVAQSAQGEPSRRFQPPPDHWMTIDSLSQALGLNPAQRTKVAPAYTALNGVMKDAAAPPGHPAADAGIRLRIHTRSGAHARAARQIRQRAHGNGG